ncbi:MAG: AAA family ATPase [Archaeoglobi archaeon]|nr:AAA family ATPase [Candidatus Mnemosynella bozhongmuii]
MTKSIGVAGKGGVGKTSIAALMLKRLLEEDLEILVVDADPNECLPDALGVEKYRTLAEIVEKYTGSSVNPEKFMADFETLLFENEQDGFDLLVMGRGEKEGCYCAINNYLRRTFEEIILKKYSYDVILMDCEAGLEHLSRKTSGALDELVVVSDSSKTSLRTIERIRDVARSVKKEIKRFHVLGNKIDESFEDELRRTAENVNMNYLGFVPHDEVVAEFNARGRSLLEIPDDSKAYKKVREVVSQLILNENE